MLPKLELSLSVRGDYMALKASLDETMQRMQPAVLRSLSLQRGGSNASEVVAATVLTLPFRPEHAMAETVAARGPMQVGTDASLQIAEGASRASGSGHHQPSTSGASKP